MNLSFPDILKKSSPEEIKQPNQKEIKKHSESLLRFRDFKGELLELELNKLKGTGSFCICLKTNAIDIRNLEEDALAGLLIDYESIFDSYTYPVQLIQYNFLAREDSYIKSREFFLNDMSMKNPLKADWVKKDLEFEKSVLFGTDSLDVQLYMVVRYDYKLTNNPKNDYKNALRKLTNVATTINTTMRKHDIKFQKLSNEEYSELMYYVCNPYMKGIQQPNFDFSYVKGFGEERINIPKDLLDFENDENLSVKREKPSTVLRESHFNIKNKIAPYVISKNDADYIQIGDCKSVIYEIYDMPEFTKFLWHKDLMKMTDNLDISYHFKQENINKVIKELDLAADLTDSSNKDKDGKVDENAYSTSVNKKQLENIKKTFDAIGDDQRLFSFSMYIRVKARTEEELSQTCETVDNVLGGTRVNFRKVTQNYLSGMVSILPLATNALGSINPMLSHGVGNTFALTNVSFSHADGRIFGKNISNNSILRYKATSKELMNPIIVITGKSGSGKSVDGKKIVKDLNVNEDIGATVIDSDSENRPSCEALGGSYVEVTNATTDRYNILAPVLDYKDIDLITNKKAKAVERLSNVLELSKNETKQLSFILSKLYEDFGFTKDFDSYYEDIDVDSDESINSGDKIDFINMRKIRKPPILTDLYELALSNKYKETTGDTKSLALSIRLITEQGDFKFWDGQTNIDLDNEIQYYGFRTCSKKYKAQAMASIYDLAFEKKLKEPSKPLVVMNEECKEIFLNDVTGEYAMYMASRFRKYKGIPIFITQDTHEVLETVYGKAVFTNAGTMIFKKQQSLNAQALIDSVEVLKPHHKINFTKMDAGECFMIFNETEIVHAQVLCSDYELEKFQTEEIV